MYMMMQKIVMLKMESIKILQKIRDYHPLLGECQEKNLETELLTLFDSFFKRAIDYGMDEG